jgi:hypothetical protein
MALRDIPLDTIAERDLQRLIAAGAAESLYIDYRPTATARATMSSVLPT